MDATARCYRRGMIFLPIPSTRGPIAVRPDPRSGEKPAEIRREGDYRPLEISADYRALGRAGLIGRRPGDDLPHLVIARDIDSGSSWQLPVALFDVLRRDGRPTAPNVEAASAIVFATGALAIDGRIEEHDYALDLKWPAWSNAIPDGRPTLVLLPPSPKREALAKRLGAVGSRDLHVDCVDDLAGAIQALRRWGEPRGLVSPRPGPTGRRPLRSTLAVFALAAIAVAAVAIVVETFRREGAAPPDRALGTQTPPPATSLAPRPEPEPLAPAPSAEIPSRDVAVALLDTPDGSPCPSVELDTAALRATPLPIDRDLMVTVPNDRVVCGIELAIRPGASTRIVVTPDLRRRALLTRLADGSLRLRPHAGLAVTDLEVELAREAEPASLRLRFRSP